MRLIGLFWQCWTVFIGNFCLPQKKISSPPNGPISLSKILAESRTGIWHLTSKALPSSCNESDQADFDFVGIEITVAVLVVAD